MVDFVSLFTVKFMCMTSYFHVISGSAHGVGGNRVGCRSSLLVKAKSDSEEDDMPFSHGGVAENVVRAKALKSENPLFKVVIHPSYVNGKDRAVSFSFLILLLGFRNTTPINFDFP